MKDVLLGLQVIMVFVGVVALLHGTQLDVIQGLLIQCLIGIGQVYLLVARTRRN